MNRTLELQIQTLHKNGKFEFETFVKIVSEYYNKLEKEVQLQKQSIELLQEELSETNQKLRLTVENQIQAVLNNIQEGVIYLDRNFKILFANKFAFQLFELNAFQIEESTETLQRLLDQFLKENRLVLENLNQFNHYTYETENTKKYLEFYFSSTVFFEERRMIIFIRDITKQEEEKINLSSEQRQLKAKLEESQSTIENLNKNLKEEFSGRRVAEATLEFLAFYDPLTGLMNRTAMKKTITEYIQNTNTAFAIVYIDLVKFKIFNDSLGHHVGDEILKLISLRLLENLPKEATLFRIGGDEFILFIKNLRDRLHVARVCQAILKRFERNFSLYGLEFHVDLDLGIAIFPQDGNDLESLLKSADTALSVAREKGGSQVKFYSQKMSLNVYEQLIMANRLKSILERNELEVFYQPKYSIKERKITSFEALLRWNHPEIGYISPAKFIPLAEQNGTIIPIGEWSIHEVCRQVINWKSAGFEFSVAINLSPVQFIRENIHKEIARILQMHQVPPSQIELEITESGVMKNLSYATKSLSSLRGIGVKISIDDFGTGYSSLSHLKEFPIHKIKIDQSFLHGIPEDKKNKGIVKAIVDMAYFLELSTIAEGVETENQLDFLEVIGCDEIQGYLIGKPLKASEVIKFVTQFHSQEVDK